VDGVIAPVVDAAWAAEHAGDVVLADVRWYLDGRSGRAAYDAGHLPGAVFVDLDRDLSAPPSPRGRHPLPDPVDFAAAMGSLGIADTDTVIAYDDAGGSIAARLWWMLDAIGLPAAVLDGGIHAWPDPLTTGVVTRAPATFTPRPWPDDRIVDAGDVELLRGSERAVVLDARAPERYRGTVRDVDPRPGHIPGATNAPWARNLDPGSGRFLPRDELRARYEALGVGAAERVAVYCGSGVTSCHDLLALELAGMRGARLYPGSWSEWSADMDRPFAMLDDDGPPG
jgi:thiosulfate/3-mercaptopyruvate sulfurtransferase